MILEADMKKNTPHCFTHCTDYDAWEKKLHAVGFETAHRSQDTVYGFIEHLVFRRRRAYVSKVLPVRV
jgi:hypothetical protein